MNFLNLKKYSNNFFNFIYSTDKEIIYTTKREVDKKEMFFICSYNLKSDSERIIKKFEMVDTCYYDYRIFYRDNKLFILNKKNNILNASKVELKNANGKESIYNIYLEGEIQHINIINERYFIVFIEKDDLLGRKFIRYLSGRSLRYKFAYLIDLYEEESYFIKDIKFVLGARDYIQLENINGEEVIFFEEAYREAWEKELYYFKGFFDNERRIKQENSINYIKFSEFILSIKSGEDRLNIKVIDSIDKSGVIRCLGSDEKSLYYRKKYFESGNEKVYSIKRDNGAVIEVCNIEHNDWDGDFYYDSDKNIIFYEEELDDCVRVKGVFNREFDITYSNYIGGFEDFIDNRYLITYYVDDVDDEYFDFVVIKDIKENKEYQYEGEVRCFDNYVILY